MTFHPFSLQIFKENRIRTKLVDKFTLKKPSQSSDNSILLHISQPFNVKKSKNLPNDGKVEVAITPSSSGVCLLPASEAALSVKPIREVPYTPILGNEDLNLTLDYQPPPTPITDDFEVESILESPLSFNEGVFSHSTSRGDINIANKEFDPANETAASIFDASIHIYKSYPVSKVNLKLVKHNYLEKENLPLRMIHDKHEISFENERTTLESHRASMNSEMSSILENDDHQLELVYRHEMVHLIEQHNILVTKQQQEIAHLKDLLHKEKQLNASYLSTSSKAKGFSNKNKKYRKKFLPMDISVHQEPSHTLSLMPPFIPQANVTPTSSKINVSSGTITPVTKQKDNISSSYSVSSSVSSIMSTSHRPNLDDLEAAIADELKKLQDDPDDTNYDSSSDYFEFAKYSTPEFMAN